MNIEKRQSHRIEEALPAKYALHDALPSAIGAALMSQSLGSSRPIPGKNHPPEDELPQLDDAVRLIRSLIDENTRLREDNRRLRDESLRYHIARALMAAPAPRPRGRPRSAVLASVVDAERLLRSLEANLIEETAAFRVARGIATDAPVSERALLMSLIIDEIDNPTRAKAALKTLQNRLANARAARKASQ